MQVGADTTLDSYGIMVVLSAGNTANTARNYIVDVGVDPAGGTSFTEVITDLLAGAASTLNTVLGNGIQYYFPLFIPAGAAIGFRARGTNTSTIYVNYVLYQRPMNPSMRRTGSFVETIGANGITGTAVTPGTTSEGTWTSIGTTTKSCWWWQVGPQVNASDTSWTSSMVYVDLAVGDGSNKDIILQNVPYSTNSSEAAGLGLYTITAEYNVPSGSTMYVRMQAGSGTDTMGVSVYGCGG